MLRTMKTHAWVWMGSVVIGLALPLGWAATACSPETRDFGKGGGTTTGGGGSAGGGAGCNAGDAVACYEGPAGTKDVGNCHAGQAICGADGKPGSCEGQVLPKQPVDCAAHEDQDCDGVPERCTLDLVWGATYGVSGGAGFVPPSLAVGPGGNIAYAGWLTGQVDFGLGAMASATGDADVFVAKFDPTGQALWAKKYGDATDEQRCNNVRVDGQGNIVLVGEYRGSLDGVGIPLPQNNGGSDAFVIKLDPTGAPLWVRWGGDPGQQTAEAVAVNKAGGVVVVGRFEGSFAWNGGGGALTSSSNGMVIYVQRFDKNGNSVFSVALGGDPMVYSGQNVYTVALDINDDVIVTGDFQGNISFPGGPSSTSAGEDDVFIAKLDGKTGELLWAHTYGTAASEQGYGVATDTQGNILMTGKFGGIMTFGGKVVAAMPPNKLGVYLTKLSPAGDVLWAKGYGGGDSVLGMFVETAENNSILLAGAFDGTLDFGGGVLDAGGVAGKLSAAGFLAKLDTDGAHLGSRAFLAAPGDPDAGQPELVIAFRVAATPGTNEIVMGGVGSGPLDLGGGVIGKPGVASPFLGKYAP